MTRRGYLYLLDVVKQTSPLLNSRDNRGEVIIRQHHIRSILRNIRPINTHSNTHISFIESRSIIDSISSHDTESLSSLQRMNHSNFRTWTTSRKYHRQRGHSIDFGIRKSIKILRPHHCLATL